jgi:hypothetical protein
LAVLRSPPHGIVFVARREHADAPQLLVMSVYGTELA